MVIWYINSCNSVGRYQNFAAISSHPEDGGCRFVRNIDVFGENYTVSVSRMRVSELDDIQLKLIEIRYKIVDWIQVAQGRVNRWTAVKAVMKFTVP